MPKRHTMSEGTTTPFRHELKATVPLALTDVLGFYRRELGKRNWKETNGAVVTADKAVIAYTSPDGPAVLKLSRKDDATSVDLVVKNPGAVAKAGIMPKPGQVKVLFGNINRPRKRQSRSTARHQGRGRRRHQEAGWAVARSGAGQIQVFDQSCRAGRCKAKRSRSAPTKPGA